MTERLRPPRLRPGDRVAVVGPSSGFVDPATYDLGIEQLERFGLSVVEAPGVRQVRGYLAGTDEQRAADLLWALGDESIAGVWCSRGGYGAQRTIAALDPDATERLADVAPKPFVGFSDITIVHAWIRQRLGWVTHYGPGVSKLGRGDDYTIERARRAVFEGGPITVAPLSECTTLVGGTAEGELAGGCLARLGPLAGTPLQVDFADKVCFLEEVNEDIMDVDEKLSQLLAAGCFDGCRGIVLGDFENLSVHHAPGLTLEEVFADLLVPLGIPCAAFLPIGHGVQQATLPIGGHARFDADRGVLEVAG